MRRAGLFIAGVALLVILINQLAAYRAENDLILRLCQNRTDVLTKVGNLLHLQQSSHQPGLETSAIKTTRGSMIAAKLLFIIPRHRQETIDQYLLRANDYITGKCHQ